MNLRCNDPDALYAWAMKHRDDSTPQVARAFEKAAHLFRVRHDVTACATCLVEGAIHWNARVGSPDRAEQLAHELRDLVAAFKDAHQRAFWKAQVSVILSRVESRRGRFRLVLRHTSRALALLSGIAWTDGSDAQRDALATRVAALLNRGYAFYHLGGLMGQARECAEEIERICPQCRFDVLLLKAATFYANNPHAALEIVRQILQLTDNLEEQSRADVLMIRSQALLFLGRYQEAINDGEECIRIEQRPGRLPVFHTVLGRVYLYTNDSSRAISHLETAKKTFERFKIFGTGYLESGSQLTAAYLSANQIHAAITVAEEVRKRLRRSDVQYAEGWANLELHLIGAYLQAAQAEPARRDFYLKQSREALKRAESKCRSYGVGLAYVRYCQGVLAQLEDDVVAARRFLRNARRLCSRYGLAFLRWRCLQAAAYLENDTERSLHFLRAAARDIRSLRDNISSPLLTPLFFDDKSQVFESLVQLLFEMQPSGKRLWAYEALEHIESFKARNIVTTLAASSAWPSVRAGIRLRSPELVANESLVLSAQRSLPTFTGNGTSRSSARNAFAPKRSVAGSISRDIRMLRRTTEESESRYMESLLRSNDIGQHLVHPLDVHPEEMLATLLDAQTAVLEYFIAEDKLFCFVCADGQVMPMVREVNLAHLRAHIGRCLPSTRRPEVRLDAAQQLYAALCGGLDSVLAPYTHWIIVPHGELRQLPFGLLHDGHRFLSEKVDGLVHAPSLTVLWLCRRRQKITTGTSPILCSPPFGPPWSLLEGELVGNKLKNKPGVVPQLFCGVEARAELLTSTLNAPSVHIATHGAFNASEPLHSSLLLSSVDGKAIWLRAQEFFGFRWNTGLVTCAACESGKTFVPRGDGIVGLRYGFFSAGAPSVLDAQWAVNDLATALLMDAFYGHWSDGKDKAESLILAQRYLMQMNGREVQRIVEGWLTAHPDFQGQSWCVAIASEHWYGRSDYAPFSNPSYWAAFTLQGDWL